MLNTYRNLKLAIILYQANNSGGAWRSITTYYRNADLKGDAVKLINRTNRRTFRQAVASTLAAPRILFNGLDSFHRWEAIAICLFRRDALIYLHETDYVFDQFQASYPFAYRLVKRILARNPVLAVSEQAAALYRQRFNSRNVHVAYECLPPKAVLPAPAKGDRKRICMIGSIDERKGASFFSQLADRAYDEGRPWEFHWIGGRGSQEPCYQSPCVKWWGWQNNPRDLLKHCDLFFLASVDDPFPLACLEALQDHVKAVAYTKTGVSEILRDLDGCSVFDEYRIDTALEAIQTAMETDLDPAEVDRLMAERIEVEGFQNRMDLILSDISNEQRQRVPARSRPTESPVLAVNVTQNNDNPHFSEQPPTATVMNHSPDWIDETSTKGLVSVIMPTYNREKFILAAVESVYKQDYRPIEVVIADDGSTDNTEEILSAWLGEISRDSDFTVSYSRKPNGGASSARNWAVERSRGEFLLYLDSDDCLLPGAIKRAVGLLEDNEAPYAYFRVQNADENLQPLDGYLGQPFAGNDNDFTDYLWHTMGPVYRRSTIAQVGPWSEDLTAVDDWEYGTRVKLMGFQGIFDKNVIGLYRDHQDSRLNVYSFNRKYVLNVEKACDLIAHTAEAQNRLSSTLRKKIALRMVIHAVEFGMHHHREDCRRLLQKSQMLLPQSKAFQAGTALLKRFSGGATCNLLWQLNELRMKAKA